MTVKNCLNLGADDFVGFFSVQVLDKALEVWGLKYVPRLKHNLSDFNGPLASLTPWRNEIMRPYHDHPE